MKSILYVFVNRSGKIETFQGRILPEEQNDPDDALLDRYQPENVKVAVEAHIEPGFSLCNWHVIES